jgi:geranylgeranyl pyrophosphate synthase
MNNYDNLPEQIKQLTSLYLNEAFQTLSLQKVVEPKEYTSLLSNCAKWDQHFANLVRNAVGLTDPESKALQTNLIDNLSSLVVFSCGAICSKPEKALPAAAAMNLIFIAAGLFDDIQDQDKANSLVAKVGIGETLNVGLTLLLLGQELLTDTLKVLMPMDDIFPLKTRLNRCLLIGIRGQLLDLQEETIPLRIRLESPDYYLVKNGLKAATIFSYLTELGAALGYKDSKHEFVAVYSQFGFALGMVVQLIADLGDFLASNKPGELSRDLTQQLPTVPSVYAYQALTSEFDKNLVIELWQKTPVAFDELIALFNTTPAVSQTIALITQYAIQAEKYLKVVDPTLEKPEHKSMLLLLRSFVGSLRGHFLP